jgi:hypothetical protein
MGRVVRGDAEEAATWGGIAGGLVGMTLQCTVLCQGRMVARGRSAGERTVRTLCSAACVYNIVYIKGSLVHVAPACVGFGHFGSYVRSLSLHFLDLKWSDHSLNPAQAEAIHAPDCPFLTSLICIPADLHIAIFASKFLRQNFAPAC